MFIVIELQKSADGVVSNIVTSHEEQGVAESQYHSILAAAAISRLPVHSATILTEEGFQLAYKCYKHN